MEVTILDLINLKKLDGMRLVAGKNGLSRKIKDCGILDYEFDSNLKDKYLYSNFHEGQFALTTFLYAKDNEHLIGDAVKYLVEKKVSGLAIKNIYRLNLHDYVLRYADSKDFPIFLIEDKTIYFENIIISIDECIKNMMRMDFGQNEIDTILHGFLDDSAIKRQAIQLNPSFCNHYNAVYFYLKKELTINEYDSYIARFKSSQFYTPFSFFCRYRNGFMMLYSYDSLDKNDESAIITDIINEITDYPHELSIGVSETHHHLHEMKQAINECLHAAMLHQNSNCLYMSYKNIGTYKVIFPYASDKEMQLFSKNIIDPIRDFDAENKFKLTETLIQFIECNGNLNQLSRQISLHENTLRYRLEKIELLNGLNFRNPEHYEQLSLAVKIYICNELINSF